jgi:uncharacterized protein
VTNPAAGMPCPVCKVPLVMSDRQGVEIDYCPQCRGVWLDRGELDKIIERDPGASAPPPPQPAPQAPQAPPPPQYSQPHYAPPPPYGYGHGHYGHKRKKHWLEDIFD